MDSKSQRPQYLKYNTLIEEIKENSHNQGRWTNSNKHRRKPWWNTTILQPLVKTRNKARREIPRHQSQEKKQLYYWDQEAFQRKVEELKRTHWKVFQEEKGPEHAYKAYRFTKERDSNTIAPPKNPNGETIDTN
ncbi:hypothetical protein O181_012306 [Austropuccinia psidii MF-1]|uniref:Uncharacterized protein n=1 Tax=Austropuccinia psidii MF-1 TaxID=1389203 RepID=A0A9Q3BUF7_9BASI|nr:hypothetical protein [Austropuccinia psidii MF-1]